MRQYAVPFFIWANYDIQEREDVVISPNFLGVLTAQAAGLPLTGYMEFLPVRRLQIAGQLDVPGQVAPPLGVAAVVLHGDIKGRSSSWT